MNKSTIGRTEQKQQHPNGPPEPASA